MKTIDTIFLDENNFGNYKYINELDFPKRVSNFSKINLFVGEINSGKSKFMRNLFSVKEFEYHLKYPRKENIYQLIEELKNEISMKCGDLEIIDYGYFIEKIDSFEYEYSNDFSNNVVPLKDLLKNLKAIKETTRFHVGYAGTDTGRPYPKNFYNEINPFLQLIGEKYYKRLDKMMKQNSRDFLKIYIPTLRGLRPLGDNNKEIQDYYFIRTVKDYFDSKYSKFNEKSGFQIFTGLNMYKEVKNLLLGDHEEREKIKQYENFLSENFFNDKQVTLIPHKNEDVLVVKIGNERERPIYSLGDGLQEIIIMTFQAFNHRGNNCLFFIEEPEIHLHPGLLRKLIKVFNSFEDCQFFLTTHSNHLLDLSLELETADMSIYKFNKAFDDENEGKQIEPNFEIENVANGTFSILDELGVQNTSVYLANCTIWVEGATDRYYLRHYLNLYMDYLKNYEPDFYVALKEDIHYTFIDYGGNNITHWSFLDNDDDDEQINTVFKNINVDSICKKVLIITDRDSEAKRERHEKLKENLGVDNYYCLEVKEIENLISVKTLKKVIEEYEKGKVSYAREFTENDYKDKSLGEFIKSILCESNRKGSYAEKSGTVTRKSDFCSKAIKFTKDKEDLSDDALKITKKVYDFIKKQNNLS